MKFLIFWSIVTVLFLTNCNEDDNDNRSYRLEGTWILKNTAIQVRPRKDREAELTALQDSLNAYTFFAENSVIVFRNDSIRFVIDYPEFTQPALLHCYLQKDFLSITPPDDMPLIIEGTVEFDPPILIFTLTADSYMTILKLADPSFLDRILSAQISYFLQRIP